MLWFSSSHYIHRFAWKSCGKGKQAFSVCYRTCYAGLRGPEMKRTLFKLAKTFVIGNLPAWTSRSDCLRPKSFQSVVMIQFCDDFLNFLFISVCDVIFLLVWLFDSHQVNTKITSVNAFLNETGKLEPLGFCLGRILRLFAVGIVCYFKHYALCNYTPAKYSPKWLFVEWKINC